jgi:hypothetical protein
MVHPGSSPPRIWLTWASQTARTVASGAGPKEGYFYVAAWRGVCPIQVQGTIHGPAPPGGMGAEMNGPAGDRPQSNAAPHGPGQSPGPCRRLQPGRTTPLSGRLLTTSRSPEQVEFATKPALGALRLAFHVRLVHLPAAVHLWRLPSAPTPRLCLFGPLASCSVPARRAGASPRPFQRCRLRDLSVLQVEGEDSPRLRCRVGTRVNWAFGLNWVKWPAKGGVTGLCCTARRNGRGWCL